MKMMSKSCKGSKCNYAKAFAEAEAKIQLLLATNTNEVIKRKKNRVYVVVGAADIKKGRGTAAFNGASVKVSPMLAKHAQKVLGLNIGDQHSCGYTVGRCAEWRAANKLIKSGSKIKHIRWTLAYFVDDNGNGGLERGTIVPYCAVCVEGFGLEN